MKNPFKKPGNATAPDVAAAEEKLRAKRGPLEAAETVLAEAREELSQAHAADADAAALTKLENAVSKATATRNRAQAAYDAAEQHLQTAREAAAEADQTAMVKRLDEALKTRLSLATKLAKNATERGDIIRGWLNTEREVVALKSAGLVSPHASPRTFNVGHLLNYLKFEDRRAVVDLEGRNQIFPYTGGGWANRTTMPALVEVIKVDNATIKGE